MKDLYILGAGGHAKEVYFLEERIVNIPSSAR
jgi:hypothetical protein